MAYDHPTETNCSTHKLLGGDARKDNVIFSHFDSFNNFVRCERANESGSSLNLWPASRSVCSLVNMNNLISGIAHPAALAFKEVGFCRLIGTIAASIRGLRVVEDWLVARW
jgi:hypothetical protein